VKEAKAIRSRRRSCLSSRRAGSLAAPLLLLAAHLPGPAAVLSGVVVENKTSRPLARAKVTLSAPGMPPATALTNASGLFTFSALAAGSYLVTAEREGFAPRTYGQRRFGEPGTPIALQADSHFAVELRLVRLGAISGEVVDENQVGLPGVMVTAYAAGPRLRPAGVARTDDRGAFRIAGLKPGRYLLRTSAKQLEGGLGLLATYHGQTPSAREALPVDVKLDEEVGPIRITPLVGKLATLTGRIHGGAAERVLLLGEAETREARPGPGGGFEFAEVEPGAYYLLADGAGKAAYAEILMGQEDRTVTLELKPPPVLEVRCAAVGGEPVDLRAVSVFLRRKEGGDSSRRIHCGEKAAWEAGRWELAVATPPELYVASVLEADRTAELAELRLRPGETTTVSVQLSARPASLEGTVRTADGVEAPGAPVLLRAADPELAQRVGGVRRAQTDGRGKFRIAGLPPGRYEVVSSYQLSESDGLPGQFGTATPVALEEGQQIELDLVLTPLE
jgi:hypothetical protein